MGAEQSSTPHANGSGWAGVELSGTTSQGWAVVRAGPELRDGEQQTGERYVGYRQWYGYTLVHATEIRRYESEAVWHGLIATVGRINEAKERLRAHERAFKPKNRYQIHDGSRRVYFKVEELRALAALPLREKEVEIDSDTQFLSAKVFDVRSLYTTLKLDLTRLHSQLHSGRSDTTIKPLMALTPYRINKLAAFSNHFRLGPEELTLLPLTPKK